MVWQHRGGHHDAQPQHTRLPGHHDQPEVGHDDDVRLWHPGMSCKNIGLPGKSILGEVREKDFPKTLSLTENQFSGKTYFYNSSQGISGGGGGGLVHNVVHPDVLLSAVVSDQRCMFDFLEI